jgi:hypothetical protein
VLSSVINELLYPFFIRLSSHPRTVTCNKKILLVKYIYKKQLIIKNGCNKKSPTICIAYEMNKTELSICVVTKLWTCRFRLSIPDCDRRVKHTDIRCWIYSIYTTFKMYGGLKSFQTTMSFQPRSSLFFAYFLAFFMRHTKNHVAYMIQINYLLVNKKEILIFGIKKLFWIWSFLIAMWFSQSLVATLSLALSYSNFPLK